MKYVTPLLILLYKNGGTHMNQNKDCNCNDGIQTMVSDNRYPYANDHNAVLQNMNYKDWMVMSQRGLVPRVDNVTAATIGTTVAATLLWGFATNPIVGAGAAVICAFAALFPILWPDEQEPKKIWVEFMKYGETIFGKVIQEVEKNRALTYLVGMKKELEKYNDALEAWKKNKNRKTAEIVKQEFNDAGDYIDTKLEELKLEGYREILLPCYAQAAFLHLNLLQQGVAFGDEWDESSNFEQDYWYNLLMKRMEEYIDYCTKTYHDGLNILKNSPDITWSIYNTYRRDMTLTVLDLIALFPNYDMRKYPKGTKTELTREIYMDVGNEIIDRETTLEQCEASLTREPHVFTWLTGMKLFTNNDRYLTKKNCLGGVQSLYKYTNNMSALWSPLSGSNYTHVSEQILPSNFEISKFKILRYKNNNIAPLPIGITEMKWKINLVGNEGQYEEVIYNVDSGGSNESVENDIQIEQPKCNSPEKPCNLASHILSGIFIKQKKYGNYDLLYKYSFGWTHTSVNRHNTIAEDAITQIPAVKAASVKSNKGNYVVKGPGHTGGDIVKLNNYTKITIKCKVPQGKKYKVRIRYAANKDCELGMYIYHNGQTTVKKLLKTYSSEDYTKYSSFQYIDFIENILMYDDNIHFDLYDNNNTSDTSILIDKIEFIPLEH